MLPLLINRVQDQLVHKNKADLSGFMGKGVVEDEDIAKNLMADGFKWALVSVASFELGWFLWYGFVDMVKDIWGLGKAHFGAVEKGKNEIISKLDDLDKRAKVVLEGQGAPRGGYQWKIQEESNLPDDEWSSTSFILDEDLRDDIIQWFSFQNLHKGGD
ncbi:hypothetical protein ACJX0J_012822 [Zea mays]